MNEIPATIILLLYFKINVNTHYNVLGKKELKSAQGKNNLITQQDVNFFSYRKEYIEIYGWDTCPSYCKYQSGF